MGKDEIVRRAWDEFEGPLREAGYELVEVEYAAQGHTPVLRFFIDKESGVTLDDCAAASQMLDPLIDAADFTPGQYMLEVSSPGIDRPVRKPADFERFLGEEVRLSTILPTNGRRNFRGILTGCQDGMIVLDCAGRSFEIHLENLKKANLNR